MARQVPARKSAAKADGTRPPTPLEKLEQSFLTEVSPALREKIDQIKQWYRGEARHGLLSHYKLGLIVKDVYDDEEDQGGEQRYGRRAMRKLCHALPWCKTSLYDALSLVQAYPEEEVARLAQLRTASGQPLCWSHVRLLADVGDRAGRDDLLNRVLAEGLTCEELGREVQRLNGPKANRRGGQPRAPRTVEQVVRQQGALADRFLERAGQVWRGEGSLTSRVRDLTPAEHTEERAGVLREHAERLRRLAREADERAREAEEVYEHFVKAVARQRAEDPGPEEEEPEEAEVHGGEGALCGAGAAAY
jgi:hypothetical protein